MPGPLGPAAVFGPAAIVAGPGAIVAAKHLACRVATSPSVTSATLTAVLFYWSFQKLPCWVKEDISFKNLLGNHEEMSQEEFVGLFSVVEKLQNLSTNIQELDTDIPQIYAALLAFIQLSGQIKARQIDLHRSVRNRGKATESPSSAAENNDSDSDSDNQSVCSSSATADASTASSDSCIASSPSVVTESMRDSLYETAGNALDLPELRSSEIQNALKMATLAYHEEPEMLAEKLHETDFTLVHYNLKDIRPGKVAHYIAVSPTEELVFVGLRGTSTLGDLLTDCCGHAVPLVDDHAVFDKVRVEIQAAVPNIVVAGSHNEDTEVISGHERIVLEDHDHDGDNFTRCHEGILISARNVVEEIESVLLPLIECGYRIVLCGHSLGAGTAIIVATLLRSKYPELFLEQGNIHVYAFGAPPVLDHDSAIAACSYCTTIVNNADLISRLNITNLAVSLTCLRKIQSKLAEKEMSPTGPVTGVSFWNKIAEGVGGTPLMTLSEMNETIREAHDNLALRKPEHLFVPGRVLLCYNRWLDDDNDDDGGDNEGQEDQSRAGNNADNLRCVETTGASPVFQRLEIDGLRCFTDHLTSSYFEILGMEYEF